ncbi:MAG: GAF domain-containing protein [Reichenbachiella sp.]|uniref:GAF domain-containing protein n=1 Tax=Reichenbachiella sp. TaxID=2184521 RepID=UPI003297B8F6
MSENLFLPDTDNRIEKYEALIPQIEALISSESDLIANLANVSAALKEGLGFFWVGFYLVKGDELVLGPFQGPIACTRIKEGKGVCGTAWDEKRTLLVDDVDQFPGHIACSSASKSEIVLPAMKNGEVALILDIDSDQLADFSQEDQTHLERLMKIIETKL